MLKNIDSYNDANYSVKVINLLLNLIEVFIIPCLMFI